MNNAQEQEKNAAAADLPERPRRKTVWKICRILILLIPGYEPVTTAAIASANATYRFDKVKTTENSGRHFQPYSEKLH